MPAAGFYDPRLGVVDDRAFMAGDADSPGGPPVPPALDNEADATNQDPRARGNQRGGPARGSRLAFQAGWNTTSDPDDIYAQMTRQDYMDYLEHYREFELDLIQRAQTDTSLIDQAKEDAPAAVNMAVGVGTRNRDRYGWDLTPAQRQSMERDVQRVGQLGWSQSVNTARIAQKEANTGLMSDLINIGQGINRASLGQMAAASSSASARRQAYMQAKAANRASNISTVGQIATTAMLIYAMSASDYRLKENVTEDIPDAVDRVRALKPRRFNFIAANPRTDTIDGFMAHEVAEQVPEAIYGEKNAVDARGYIDPQRIDPAKLVPVLTAALQSALDTIDSLESRLTSLENNNAT